MIYDGEDYEGGEFNKLVTDSPSTVRKFIDSYCHSFFQAFMLPFLYYLTNRHQNW